MSPVGCKRVKGEGEVFQELSCVLNVLFGNHQYCRVSHRSNVCEALTSDEATYVSAAENTVDQSNVLGAECSYQGEIIGHVLSGAAVLLRRELADEGDPTIGALRDAFDVFRSAFWTEHFAPF